MNAIVVYRAAHYLKRSGIPVIPRILEWTMFLLFNSVIPAGCHIGKKSRFGHGGIGVVLHPECKIGDRVLIGQGVTIGGTFGSGVPVIEDDVWIGPGARILGNVIVKSNSVIGANAVVTSNVTGNCVVGGIPAKIIREIQPGALDTAGGILK